MSGIFPPPSADGWCRATTADVEAAERELIDKYQATHPKPRLTYKEAFPGKFGPLPGTCLVDDDKEDPKQTFKRISRQLDIELDEKALRRPATYRELLVIQRMLGESFCKAQTALHGALMDVLKARRREIEALARRVAELEKGTSA